MIGRPPFHLYLQRVCVQRPLDYFDFSRGTLAPLFRASDSPIAIACFLLLTIPPLPPFPERRVPRFLRRIAARTDSLAAFPYLAIGPSYGFVPVIESLHTRRFGDEKLKALSSLAGSSRSVKHSATVVPVAIRDLLYITQLLPVGATRSATLSFDGGCW